MPKFKTSDAGIFLWHTYQTLQDMGLDANTIFAGVRLPAELPDKSIRRDNSTQQRFWATAEQISQDSDIGLHVGEHFPVCRGEIIEYLFLSSPTFGEGLQRAIRYQHILTDALSFDLKIQGNSAIICGLQHPVRHYLECAIGVFLKFLLHISQRQFTPQAIWLPYADGAMTDEYRRVWGCETQLGMSEGCIRFDARLLSLASPSAEPTLLKVHEQIAEQQLKVLDKYQLITDIENLLSSGLLETGEVDQNLIAEKLNRHPRTLRADLQAIHITFEKVLANYREKTAKRLLINPHISLDQIVYLLGFSEPSAFSRAFKRWTGETPSTYRQRKQPK